MCEAHAIRAHREFKDDHIDQFLFKISHKSVETHVIVKLQTKIHWPLKKCVIINPHDVIFCITSKTNDRISLPTTCSNSSVCCTQKLINDHIRGRPLQLQLKHLV